LSSGLKALESVGATRFGAHEAPNRRRIIERAPSGACGWSVHLELRGNRMGLGTASDAADRDPGQRDRAGLREGGTAGAGLILVFAGNYGVRSNERDPEARRDPGGGCRRLKPACQRRRGADARAPAALRSDLFDPAISPHRHPVRRARQKLLLRPLLRRYAGVLVVTD
jgi:hypothetical protein